MTDRIIATSGHWSIASDGIQWILQRHYDYGSRPLSFVRSDKTILARCMREKGVADAYARQLLSGLPDTFDQWKRTLDTSDGQ